MSDPRLAAARILENVLTKAQFYNEAKIAEAASPKDNAFINMLVLTVLRRLVFLEQSLAPLLRKKAKSRIKSLLLCAAAELFFLETPDYAVINSYVNLAKKTDNPFTGNFVNAVLRNLARGKDKLPQPNAVFPQPFRRLLQKDYDAEEIAALETEFLNQPPLDLTVKENPDLWAERLQAELLPGGSLRLQTAGKIPDLPGYREGAWWVQDFSAALPVKTLPPLAGKKVLDLCAAPGGKTAQLINAGAKVTAVDVSEPRLQTLRENLKRLHLNAEEIICADALTYLDSAPSDLDVILLDAPCSATGTIRRHPELIHIKSADDVAKQLPLQRQLLQKAAKILPPDGILLYCTCSLAKAEGEEQVRALLSAEPQLKLRPLSFPELPEIVSPEGWIRTLPRHMAAQGGCDAFFIAQLQKVT